MDDNIRDRISLLEARHSDLESLFTHLQRTMEELNEVLIAQGKRLDQLESRLTILGRQFSTLNEPPAAPRDPQDERPPHY